MFVCNEYSDIYNDVVNNVNANKSALQNIMGGYASDDDSENEIIGSISSSNCTTLVLAGAPLPIMPILSPLRHLAQDLVDIMISLACRAVMILRVSKDSVLPCVRPSVTPPCPTCPTVLPVRACVLPPLRFAMLAISKAMGIGMTCMTCMTDIICVGDHSARNDRHAFSSGSRIADTGSVHQAFSHQANLGSDPLEQI